MLETLEGPRHPVGSVGEPRVSTTLLRTTAAATAMRRWLDLVSGLNDGLVSPLIIVTTDGGGVS
jgi:hypothetical protein